jgi:predicted AlkP superfamily pyrophosphatase or phosphodiesterase
MTPDYYYHYSKHSDYQTRIDQMIEWLSLPEAQRPSFVAGYFSLVDSMGHDFGPDSQEVYNAVQKMDNLIGQLHRRITQLPQDINLVLVADHGMSAISKDSVISIDALNLPNDWTVKNTGPRVLIYTNNADIETINTAKQQLRLKANKRYLVLDESILKKRHYVGGSRIPDIILETKAPSVFSFDGKIDYQGTHGYANTDDMAAMFVAQGPAFKSGFAIDELSNLEIYPVIAKILGLKLIRQVDSEGNTLKQALN